ncbi:precorrin-8X methylmutase, partial [Salmonella enterica]|uniref:precorrin-8X methylmutase n=1 Tax=Salmonella enterica TaxID=28901 RepID=UPI003CEF7F12
EIYRESFATIRREADLSLLPEPLHPLAIRLVHAVGDLSILADLYWSGEVVATARDALAGGAPLLVDAVMVEKGI